MQGLVLYFLASAFVAYRHGVNGACPSNNSIQPCTCKSLIDKTGDEFSIITCRGFHSEDALERVLAATRGYHVFELQVLDSALRYLPHDAFIGTTFEVLSIENSSLSALSDSDIAFMGLEKSLHLLEITNCSFVNSWDWSQLSHLQHLMEILVLDSELLDITNGINNVKHIDIEAFIFQKNNIQRLDDKVFLPFVNLNRLMLDSNDIESLKRTMFPMPATNLKIIGLSYNRLRNFPRDLFLDMPALQSLYLTGNPLHTIDEAVFKPIWKQLRLFLFAGNPLSCDCRLTWLVTRDNDNKFIHAECQGPAQFKGRPLSSVKPHELWC